MTKTIQKIAFEFWAGAGSKKDFEEWVESELRKDEPHPDACLMFNLSYYEIAQLSMRLACELHDFQPVSEQGEIWAQELLNTESEKLLSKAISPSQFCRIVNSLDAVYLSGDSNIKNGIVAYPEWFGNLGNCCDWCDSSWTLEDSPHLEKEVKKLLGKAT